MKFVIFLCAFTLSLYALSIEGFEADLYSKNNTQMKKIQLDIELKVDNNANQMAIKDALNVIISSFYAEDLLSSKGKEAFKESFKKYTAKKYNIQIKEVYIIALKSVNEIDAEKIIKAVEKYYNAQQNGANPVQPNDEAKKLIEDQMKNNTKYIDEMRDFGDVDFYRQ